MKVPYLDLGLQYKGIKKEVWRALEGVMGSSAFILGKELRDFEEKFAKFCKARYCIGVNSGTDALFLALKALGIGKGDEVITSAHTYIATALAISFTGARPVFVDIDPVTYNIDPAKIERMITKKTKVILLVHLYGHPVDMAPVMKIARGYGLKVVEDCAQAHGAEYKGKRVGTFGDAGCFSFYPTKNLGAYGDGGGIVTNKRRLDEKLRLLRDYGRRGKYENVIKGYNSRLDTMQAAVLRIKLKYLDKWTQQRRENAAYYNKLFRGLMGVALPQEQDYARHVYHLYVVCMENRDKVMSVLKKKGIQTLVHYPVPIHLQKAFRELGYKKGDFPVTEDVSRRIFSLPMYPELTKRQMEYVVKGIRGAV